MYRIQALITLLLCIIIPTIAAGQKKKATIQGQVLNPKGKPVPQASVALYDSAGSGLLTGTTTDSTGHFMLRTGPGTYQLKISMLSYRSVERKLSLQAGTTRRMGELRLKTTSYNMDEVVVRAEHSQMQMNFDKRVFNVGQDITGLGGSAIDVLNNVPSIATDIDGSISLRGNNAVRVLINGKPSSMVSGDINSLRSIPASMIKKVEIITNPSSKYSAEGSAGVINIILKKQDRRGLNGSLNAGTGYPEQYEGSANLNYRVGDINWFLDGGVDYRTDPESGSSFQRFAGPDTSYMYREQTDRNEKELEGNLRLGADYHISESEVLTANTFINIEDQTNDEEVKYTDMQYVAGGFDGNVLNRINRDNTENQDEYNFDFNLNYENKIDGDQHKLTADASFDLSHEKSRTRIVESIQQGNDEPLQQRTLDREKERDLRVNAEYKRPLGERGKLEAGLRSDAEWNDNSYRVEALREGSWQQLSAYNDNFLYLENVNAAYFIAGTEIGRFSGEVGLRAENTRIRTELKSINSVNNQNYLDIFPSVFLNYHFNEQQSLQLSYSRRLHRPWSRALLPIVDFSDNRSNFTGNPNLKPEFSNAYEAGYLQYWGTGSLLTSFYYRHRTDVIERITEQNRGVIRIYPINLATEKSWGIELSAEQEIAGAFSLTANANLYRSDRNGNYEGQVFNSQTRSFQGRMKSQWDVSDFIKYQLSMRYEGPRTTTQGHREGNTMIDSGISYKLFDGKGLLSLNVRDLLNSQNFNYTVDTDGNPDTEFFTQRQFQWSARTFSLNFQYFFGRQTEGGQRR